MLARPEQLNLTISELNKRNELFKEYNSLCKDHPDKFYQAVLCFWLGLTTAFSDLPIKQDQLKNIYTGFFCILILEKKMSILPFPDADRLQDALQKLLAFYNENYSLLIKNPQQFFSQFKKIITKIDELELESTSRQIILQTKKECFSVINHFLGNKSLIGFKDLPVPSRKTFNDFLSFSSLFQQGILGVFYNRFVTCSFKPHPFYLHPIHAENYNVQKLFIHARDRTILDGLLIQNCQRESSVVILILAGHFQNEDSYFKNSYFDFQKLFDTDIVFINHRNYSIRSNRAASTSEELAKDIVEFAHYFYKKNKRLVLYGMCGGATHMILAANILTRNQVPYKLIVDRVFTQYSNVFDYKTVKRADHYNRIKFNPLFDTLSRIGLYSLLLLLIVFFRLLLEISNKNIHFGKLLREVPEEDLLVLQAKSKKIVGEPLLNGTDLFVHPKNDIRFAVKDKRFKNKNILKQLIKDCDGLLGYISHDDTKKNFIQLRSYFTKCLELIDNEKLKSSITNDKKGEDLHPHKLYNLTTRNNMPMNQFLMGFFSQVKQTERCDTVLSTMPVYSVDHIYKALKDSGEVPLYLKDMAIVLSRFLNDLKEHHHLISYMGNRLVTTGIGNIAKPLLELLESRLFQLLSSPFAQRGYCYT